MPSNMKLWVLGISVLHSLLVDAGQPLAVEEHCFKPHFADVGWTDIVASNALARSLLREKGYVPKVSLLSVPVTFSSMKNRDIDIFLGNWMPSMAQDIKPYLADGSVEAVSKFLEGARYTLAVPEYVKDAGVATIADLAKFKDKFAGKIYGIESGNDGNRLISRMIQDNHAGLRGWNLVESSEQAMLMEVKRHIQEKKWIVFLGWEPHPMNVKFQLSYLNGGEQYFGADQGKAIVWVNTRQGYLKDCPNLDPFLRGFHLTVPMENELMMYLSEDQMSPDEAVQTWAKHNPKTYQEFQSLIASKSSFRTIANDDDKPTSLSFIQTFFRSIADVINKMSSLFIDLLNRINPWVLIVLTTLLSYGLKRKWTVSAFIAASLTIIHHLGYWEATIETMTLVLCATLCSAVVGIPTGILCAHRRRLEKVVSPLLDMMQTVPTFVYLIPALMLFGLGIAPGLIATIVFSLPATIKLTALGIKGTPHDLLEVSEAFGASWRQKLVKVEIPSAMESILTGISQAMMLSLSMVVIAALVGAEGLGKPVIYALNTVDPRRGFEAGLVIVLLAAMLDQLLKRPKRRSVVAG